MASKAKRLRRRQERAKVATKTQETLGSLREGNYVQSLVVDARQDVQELPVIQQPPPPEFITVEIVHLPDDPPRTRAKCPECGFSHKLTVKGVMGTHRVYQGNVGRVCEGVGQTPDPTAS